MPKKDISLKPEEWAKLQNEADRLGIRLASYVAGLLRRYLRGKLVPKN